MIYGDKRWNIISRDGILYLFAISQICDGRFIDIWQSYLMNFAGYKVPLYVKTKEENDFKLREEKMHLLRSVACF
jgi:hypothetical protein